MARDIKYWEKVADSCPAIQDYETRLSMQIESMTIAQLCGWLLIHGSKMTQKSISICIETGALNYNHKKWLMALRESIQQGRDIDIIILDDERPNGKGTVFLPSLL